MTILDPQYPAQLRSGVTGEPADVEGESAILKAAVHNPRAFAPLYQRYVERVYAYCLRRIGSARDAEDVTSTVFALALSKAATYRGGMVSAWLFRIARSEVATYFRRRRAHHSLDQSDQPDVKLMHLFLGTDETNPPLDAAIRSEQYRVLRRLIAALNDEERDLLALRIVAGLSAEEVGAVLGKRAGAVRTSTHRLITRLRAQWEKEYAEEADDAAR